MKKKYAKLLYLSQTKILNIHLLKLNNKIVFSQTRNEKTLSQSPRYREISYTLTDNSSNQRLFNMHQGFGFFGSTSVGFSHRTECECQKEKN